VFGTTSLKKINFLRKPPRWKNRSPLKLFSLPAPTAELGVGGDRDNIAVASGEIANDGEAGLAAESAD
jgi:hypothetical protein